MQGHVTDGDIAELVGSTAEAASAYIRGDIRRYLTLIKHGDDYTLMPPYGGETARGLGPVTSSAPSIPASPGQSWPARVPVVPVVPVAILAVVAVLALLGGHPFHFVWLPVVAIVVVRLLVGGGRRRGRG
jgi:hypothetical protein